MVLMNVINHLFQTCAVLGQMAMPFEGPDEPHDADDLPIGINDGQLGGDIPVFGLAAGEQRFHTVNQRLAGPHDAFVVLADFPCDSRRMDVCIRQPEDVVLMKQSDSFQNTRAGSHEPPMLVLRKKMHIREVVE